MINTQAELFEAAAKMMRMCDKAGISYTFKFNGAKYTNIGGRHMSFPYEKSAYEFPLAVVEGKPVFCGDELYCITPTLMDKFYPVCGDAEILENAEKFCISPKGLSWNPPKPKTVMVELLLEDAYAWAKMKKIQCSTKIYDNLGDACRKALEESK